MRPSEADDRRLGQAMVAPDVEVERIVARGDLERAGSELAVDALVGDHRHAEPGVRDDDLPADRIAIARVVGVHGDADVGEDRGRPHGRDRDPVAAVAVRERVADRDQRVVHVLVHHLEVRDRGLMERAPVDDPVRAVDPAAVPQPDEEGHHRADVCIVHREPLARVVERAPESPVLAHDRPARLLEPLPRELDERLATDVLSRAPLLRELLLDDVLRGNPGVVVAGLPEGVEPAHAVPARQDILDRAVQGMAHVQPARDVRGRDTDDVGPGVARPRAGRVQALALPGRLPARLGTRGVVPRFHRARV